MDRQDEQDKERHFLILHILSIHVGFYLMQIIGIIPSRYGSTRFPGKSLVQIAGKPLVQRVYEQAKKATLLDDVVVATDDLRIVEAVKSFGGKAIMTASTHPSGTDRLAEVMARRSEDVVINIQGDEPLIDPADIDALARPFLTRPELNMATLITDFENEEEWHNPNVVKVVCDDAGYALYFSRAPIPYPRQSAGFRIARKHIGLYAYRCDFLLQLTTLKPHPLELAESLEQLRILAAGQRILTIHTNHATIGVDTPEDAVRVESIILNRKGA